MPRAGALEISCEVPPLRLEAGMARVIPREAELARRKRTCKLGRVLGWSTVSDEDRYRSQAKTLAQAMPAKQEKRIEPRRTRRARRRRPSSYFRVLRGSILFS